MFLLLALLACQDQKMDEIYLSDEEPEAVPAVEEAPGEAHVMRMSAPADSARMFTTAPAEVTLPGDAVVVRDCYGRSTSRSRSSSRYGAGPGAASGGSTSVASAPAAAPAPRAEATRSSKSEKRKREAEVLDQGSLLKMIGTRGESGGTAADVFADGASVGADLDAALAGASGVEVAAGEPAEKKPSGKGADQGEAPSWNDRSAEEEEAAEPEEVARPQAQQGPQLDWGGTLFLSNDDSMSLASAQRLLWAVKNDGRFTPDQVRPHELLNYFSFDTVEVPEGAAFSVHASAERTAGDALTMALAVRGANPPRQPLDLTVLVDRSGSMRAEGRMEYLKRGLNVMTGSLVAGDRIDLALFDSNVCVPLENYVVGRDDPELLSQAIADMQPRGSTNLNAGLQQAYELATAHAAAETQERNQRVLLVTDAFLNTGSVNPDVVSEIGAAFEQHDVRLTGIGVGREFNDKMLDKLTEKGKGAYVYLGSEAVVDRVFGLGFESLTRTIAHDVRFALNLPKSLAVEKFYGEEASSNPEEVQPINYYAGTTQLFLQDLKARDLKDRHEVSLTISWKDAASGQAREQSFTSSVGRMLGADPHNVRKAQALMAWTDMLTVDALGGDGCSEGLADYRAIAEQLSDDAEVAYVNGLVEGRCDVKLAQRPAPVLAGVAYKIKLDTDLPIAEVLMECQGSRQREQLKAGENVASFQVPPGSCLLSLQGNVPMTTQVTVPQTGGTIRCTVRGGRMSCS